MYADALCGVSKITGYGANASTAVAVGAAVIGAEPVGVGALGVRGVLSTASDVADIGADMIEGKWENVAIKSTFAISGLAFGKVSGKLLPDQKAQKEILNTLADQALNLGKDGATDNNPPKVEESNTLNLKIQNKK